MSSKLRGLTKAMHINFVDESFRNSTEKIFWEKFTISVDN